MYKNYIFLRFITGKIDFDGGGVFFAGVSCKSSLSGAVSGFEPCDSVYKNGRSSLS